MSTSQMSTSREMSNFSDVRSSAVIFFATIMAAKTRLPLLAMAALALATAVFGAGCAFFVPVTQHGGAMSTAYCPLPLLGQPLLLLGLAALVPALVGALYHIPTNASAAGRSLLYSSSPHCCISNAAAVAATCLPPLPWPNPHGRHTLTHASR